ncbi:MAG: hypothetical protein K2G40_00005 [Muribaculaceae bacterium]|nr:hypothetical protein [Muribaculaceae bacterium]
MIELEELKKSWQSQSARIDRLENENARLRRKVEGSRINGSRGKLLRTYRVLCIVSLVMMPFCIMSFPRLDIPSYLTVVFAIFFAQATLVNFYVYMRIREIDITKVSVKDALEMVISLTRLRQRLRLLEMVLALPVIVLFFLALYQNDSYGLIGGIFGGVIGGIVGLKKEFEIRGLLRSMQSDLEELLGD